MTRPADEDDRLRAAAFAFLARLAAQQGVATWHDLQRFEPEGRRIPLVGRTGIRKPRGHEAALTIMTTYRLRPEEPPVPGRRRPRRLPPVQVARHPPGHADNVALRRAMELGKPL